jgi:hypothetical protein
MKKKIYEKKKFMKKKIYEKKKFMKNLKFLNYILQCCALNLPFAAFGSFKSLELQSLSATAIARGLRFLNI